MYVLLLSRVDKDSSKICTLNEGEHVIGRGTLLECTSKKVSRNHGLIRVTQNDGVILMSTHHNPCFYLSSNTQHMAVIKNGTSVSISDGDKIALLPDEYWFKVQIVEKVNSENNNKMNNYQTIKVPDYNCPLTNTSMANTTLQDETINETVDSGKSNLKRESSDIMNEIPPKKRKSIDLAESCVPINNNEVFDEIRIVSRSPSPDLLEDYTNIRLPHIEQQVGSGCSTPDLLSENLNQESIYETGRETRTTTSEVSISISGFETDTIIKNKESITSIATTSMNDDNISMDYNVKCPIESNSKLENEFNIQMDSQSSLNSDRFSPLIEPDQPMEINDILQPNITTQSISNDNLCINLLPDSLEKEFNREIDSQTTLNSKSSQRFGARLCDQSIDNHDILQQNIITQRIASIDSSISQLANLLENEVQQITESAEDDDNEIYDSADVNIQVICGPSVNSNVEIDASNIKKETPDELKDGSDDEAMANVALDENEIKVENPDEFNIVDNDEQNTNNPTIADDISNVKTENDDHSKDPSRDNGQPSTSGNNPATRDRCWYGNQCYRKNLTHKAEFSHPGNDDYESDPNDDRPICSFGSNCYRRNKTHRAKYQHPRQGKTTIKPPPNQKPTKPQKSKGAPYNFHFNNCYFFGDIPMMDLYNLDFDDFNDDDDDSDYQSDN